MAEAAAPIAADMPPMAAPIGGAKHRYILLMLLGAYTLAVSAFALSLPRLLSWTAVGIAAFVSWTHRSNIRRLLNGTEARISFKSSRMTDDGGYKGMRL